MTLETWLAYVAAVLLFMGAPGPSHLLMVSVAMGNGFRRSLATAAGDLSANALQMALAGLGLAGVLTASGRGFAVVKWLGVAWLVWLGVRQVRASFARAATAGPAASAPPARLWLAGFVTSAANPKAIVFFAALFPQFVDPSRPVAVQLLALGATYVVIDAAFLAGYGRAAGWLGERAGGSVRRWVDRLAGAGLIATAAVIGLRSARAGAQGDA